MNVIYSILIVVGGLGLYFGIGYLARYSFFRERRGLEFADFKAEFSEGEYPKHVLRQAYSDLRAPAGIHVKRKDELEKSLGLDDWEFELLCDDHIKAHGIKDFDQTDLAALMPMWTVEDYVKFLDRLKNLVWQSKIESHRNAG